MVKKSDSRSGKGKSSTQPADPEAEEKRQLRSPPNLKFVRNLTEKSGFLNLVGFASGVYSISISFLFPILWNFGNLILLIWDFLNLIVVSLLV